MIKKLFTIILLLISVPFVFIGLLLAIIAFCIGAVLGLVGLVFGGVGILPIIIFSMFDMADIDLISEKIKSATTEHNEGDDSDEKVVSA